MSYTLTVGGISMPVVQDTIQIQKALTYQTDTCKCTIHSPTKPNEGDEVIVTDSELGILFGGIIVNVRLADKDAQLWEIDCNDYTELVDRKLVVEGYENLSASDIVKDIIAKYCTEDLLDDVTPGAPVVENILFNYVRPSQCFKDLCDYVGWQWYIDETKHIKFFDPAAVMVPAPFDLTEETRGLWGDFKLSVDMKNLRNRVYVLGGKMLSDPQVVQWKADGVARIWTLPWGPHDIQYNGEPGIGVGEVLHSVGVENLHEETQYDYMMNFQEKYIRCSAHTTTPTEGTTMTLTAKQDIPVITTVEDYASQQAIAAVQSGDGVYEHCITDESLTTVQAAEAAGLSDLRAAANPKVSGSFLTAYAADWQPGQIIKVNLPDRGIDNVYMIQSVRLHYAATWFWTIEFGGRLLGIADFLQALVSSQQKKRNIDPAQSIQKYVYGEETLSLADELITTPRSLPFVCGDPDAICGMVVVASESGLILPPVTDGLKIWLELDEGSGQVANDKSGNGNHGQVGTTSGADTNDPTWEGGGLRFINDDIVICPHQEFSGSFTYIIVCKVNAVSDSPMLMGQVNDNALGPAIYVWPDDMEVVFIGNDLWGHVTQANTIVTGQIQMITVTYDGTNLKGYIEDVLSYTRAATPAQVFANDTGSFGVGGVTYDNSWVWCDGDKTVYLAGLHLGKALTQQEIVLTKPFIQARLAAKGVTLP